MDERVREAGNALAGASSAAALTGAGVSTASGVPDFRSEGGVWDRYDEADFSLRAFRRDPGAFWERWLALTDDLRAGDVAPNAAHRALADLESAGWLDAVVTQNVDGLHAAAGSENVVALHGRGDLAVCRSCGARVDAEGPRERARDGEPPPRCRDCDGVLEPDAVLFGQRLPEGALARARALAEDTGVFLVAGTSLTVEPAASLPLIAARHGATVVIVNDEETAHDDAADYPLRGDVTEVLPALRDAMLG
ncbi:NAD-dependent protein deacetylase [Halobacteriales archaeon QS_1_68_17]|nr:MAG: NAD-dependent protein deacetylase [Halobacteriales archaeon QS_1_68_17]